MAPQTRKAKHQPIHAMQEQTPAISYISRCPDEILICIFEVAVNEAEDLLVAATVLSHVCRSWRHVALSTSKFWGLIIILLNRPIDDILAYLDRSLDRVKSRSVSIEIGEIYDEGPTLGELKIGRFAAIEKLTLGLCGNDSIHHHLISDKIDYRDCKIQTLEIYFHAHEQMNHTWNGHDLLAQFPFVEGLTLHFEDSMILERNNRMHQIRYLEFNYMEVPLLLTVWCFPHVESLVLREVQLYDGMFESTSIIPLEQLKRIDISAAEFAPGVFEHWLGHIAAPKLTDFLIPDDVLHGSLSFITKHPSITTFEWCPVTTIDMSRLSEAAPQLETLGVVLLDEIDYSAAMKALTHSHFFHLQFLSIMIDHFAVFSLDSFEEFVTGRCLPSHHPRSRRSDSVALIRELTMIALSIESHGWMASEFYRSATKMDEVTDRDVTSITLSWTETVTSAAGSSI